MGKIWKKSVQERGSEGETLLLANYHTVISVSWDLVVSTHNGEGRGGISHLGVGCGKASAGWRMDRKGHLTDDAEFAEAFDITWVIIPGRPSGGSR